MLNILIKAVFWIIGKIADIILIPIMAIVNALVPNLSIGLNNIFNYLEMGFQYVPFFFKCFLIPPVCVQMVLSVFTIYLSFIVGVRAYNFIMKIYNRFKP